MICCRIVRLVACLIAVVSLTTSNARAQWTMIEDFDQYDVEEDLDGLSNGFGEWTATPGFFLVEEDPTDADNRVLLVDEVDTGTKNSYLDDPRINVADGTTATLFLRFYRGEADSHVNFGLSDVAEPSAWADYEAQARDRYDEFFSRSAGEFVMFDNIDEMPVEEWIHYWIVTNNATDTNEYYLQSESLSPTPMKLSAGGQSVFDYRNGTADPLIRFLLRMNNESTWLHLGSWYLDDVYLDTNGENLTDPRDQVGLLGDYNGNGALDAGDLDEVTGVMLAGGYNAAMDLNQDDAVDMLDRVEWLESPSIAHSYVGDWNLDKVFDSADFVQVFVEGKYETQDAASFAQGDSNGDGVFDSADMVEAFVGGGYEEGARPAAHAVPEPSGLVLVLPLLGLLGGFRRSKA